MNFEQSIPLERSEEELRHRKIAELKSKRDLFYTRVLDVTEEEGEKRYKVLEKASLIQKKIRRLGKNIKEMGFEPINYVFWHILIGSTPNNSPDYMELDTPNGDIEKLLDELI